MAVSQLSDAQRYGGCQQEWQFSQVSSVQKTLFMTVRSWAIVKQLQWPVHGSKTFKALNLWQTATGGDLQSNLPLGHINMVNLPLPFPLQSKLLSCYVCRVPQQVWFHKVHSKHISILASSCNRSNDSILTLSPSNFFCSVRFGWLFSSLRQLNHVLKAQRVQSSLAPQECVEDSRDQCLDLSQALKKSCSQQPGTALNVR